MECPLYAHCLVCPSSAAGAEPRGAAQGRAAGEGRAQAPQGPAGLLCLLLFLVFVVFLLLLIVEQQQQRHRILCVVLDGPPHPRWAGSCRLRQQPCEASPLLLGGFGGQVPAATPPQLVGPQAAAHPHAAPAQGVARGCGGAGGAGDARRPARGVRCDRAVGLPGLLRQAGVVCAPPSLASVSTAHPAASPAAAHALPDQLRDVRRPQPLLGDGPGSLGDGGKSCAR